MWNKHSYNCKQIQRCFKNKYKTAYDSQQGKSKEKDKSWQMTEEFKTITVYSFLLLKSERHRLLHDFGLPGFLKPLDITTEWTL